MCLFLFLIISKYLIFIVYIHSFYYYFYLYGVLYKHDLKIVTFYNFILCIPSFD